MYIATATSHAESIMTLSSAVHKAVSTIVAMIVMTLFWCMMNTTASLTVTMQIIWAQWTLPVCRIARCIRVLKVPTMVHIARHVMIARTTAGMLVYTASQMMMTRCMSAATIAAITTRSGEFLTHVKERIVIIYRRIDQVTLQLFNVCLIEIALQCKVKSNIVSYSNFHIIICIKLCSGGIRPRCIS